MLKLPGGGAALLRLLVLLLVLVLLLRQRRRHWWRQRRKQWWQLLQDLSCLPARNNDRCQARCGLCCFCHVVPALSVYSEGL
jgi:hypothetical protein